MSTEAEYTARIEAAQAKRKANADSETLPKLAQRAADLEALADLEVEHGNERIVQIDLVGWVPEKGAATMVIALLPNGNDAKFKRFIQQANESNLKAKGKVDASEMFGRGCIVYPSKVDHPDMLAATLALAPGVCAHVAREVVVYAQGKAIERGN